MAQCIDDGKLRLIGVKRTERKKELGRGAYGFVIEVSVNGTICAAKVIHEILVEQVADFKDTEKKFLNECANSSRMLHPNVVQFLGIYYPSPKDKLPWLIVEMMYTDLTSLIEKYETTDLPLHIKLSILVDTSQGLQYLHSKDVIHRDLSSNNILLTKHMVAKIADFGQAKVILKVDKYTQAPGTQAFMAPETLCDPARYGKPLDVFSLSCVAAHMISMQWPGPSPQLKVNEETGKLTIRSEVQRREKYLAKMTDCSILKELTVRCLQNDPDNRPTIQEVTKDLQNIKTSVWKKTKHADDSILELLNGLSLQEQLVSKCQQQIIEKEQQKAELQSKHEKERVAIYDELEVKKMQLSLCNKEKDDIQIQSKETEKHLQLSTLQLNLTTRQLDECQKEIFDLKAERDRLAKGRDEFRGQVEQLSAKKEERDKGLRAIAQQVDNMLKEDSNTAVVTPSLKSPRVTTPMKLTSRSSVQVLPPVVTSTSGSFSLPASKSAAICITAPNYFSASGASSAKPLKLPTTVAHTGITKATVGKEKDYHKKDELCATDASPSATTYYTSLLPSELLREIREGTTRLRKTRTSAEEASSKFNAIPNTYGSEDGGKSRCIAVLIGYVVLIVFFFLFVGITLFLQEMFGLKREDGNRLSFFFVFLLFHILTCRNNFVYNIFCKRQLS